MSSNHTEHAIDERGSLATDRPLRVPDPVALAQLWAAQFQHLTTLGVAGAGGVLVLLQANLIPPDQKWWLALGLFALTALSSTYGQIAVVDQASEGKAPGKKPRVLRGLALAFLGAAGGAAFGTLVK